MGGPAPLALVLDLSRAQNAGEPYGFDVTRPPQKYLLHGEGGSVKEATLLWDQLLLDDLAALPYFVAARTAGLDGPVLRMLFAQASRRAPLVTFLGHNAPVNQAAFSPDGTRVVTASWDKTARVWDATTGKPVTPPLEHQGFVSAAAFSRDGTRVVTASKDQTARVWNLPIDNSPLDDWRQVVRCSPFAIIDDVFTINPAPLAVCQHHR
jgi:WD40 repeat protein